MDIEISASFSPDTSDIDKDGLTAYEELVVYLTNPESKDTDGDGLIDGDEVDTTFNPNIDDTRAIQLVINKPEYHPGLVAEEEVISAYDNGIDSVLLDPSQYDLYYLSEIKQLHIGQPLVSISDGIFNFGIPLSVSADFSNWNQINQEALTVQLAEGIPVLLIDPTLIEGMDANGTKLFRITINE
jgi:hypothetical protein